MNTPGLLAALGLFLYCVPVHAESLCDGLPVEMTDRLITHSDIEDPHQNLQRIFRALKALQTGERTTRYELHSSETRTIPLTIRQTHSAESSPSAFSQQGTASLLRQNHGLGMTMQISRSPSCWMAFIRYISAEEGTL